MNNQSVLWTIDCSVHVRKEQTNKSVCQQTAAKLAIILRIMKLSSWGPTNFTGYSIILYLRLRNNFDWENRIFPDIHSRLERITLLLNMKTNRH